MKKANRKTKDDLQPEYDFASMKRGVRGKYATQTRSRTNLVLLEPEIAKAFPTDASVNQVLRVVLDLTSQVPLKVQAAPVPPSRGKRHGVARDAGTITQPLRGFNKCL